MKSYESKKKYYKKKEKKYIPKRRRITLIEIFIIFSIILILASMVGRIFFRDEMNEVTDNFIRALGFIPEKIGSILGFIIFLIFIVIRIRTLIGDIPETNEYQKKLEFHIPHDKVFDICIETLKKDKRPKILLENSSQGKIIFKLGMSVHSFGEKITFKINAIDDKNSALEVLGSQVIKSTMYKFKRTEEIISHVQELANRYEKE